MQVVRFLKNDQSGEVAALVKIPGIRVTSCERSFGFSWNMNQEQKAEAAAYYTELFEKAWKMGGDQDVLATCPEGLDALVQLVVVRGGKMIGSEHFVLEHAGDEPAG